MYRIIGADGKEYGPITPEQLRQWVAEGRANAQTKVLLEGTTEWKSLSEFPEFLIAPSVPVGAPPTFSTAGMQVAGTAVLDQVNGPAIGLIVTAVIGFVAQVGSLVWRLAVSGSMSSQPQVPAWVSGSLPNIIAVVSILVSGLILVGGIKMKRLENYGLVMAASIIAMIPCFSPCCIVGLPIGIWAIVVLSKPEVKAAFH